MRSFILALIVLLPAGCAAPESEAEVETTAITHISVVDVVSGEVLEDRTVLVEGDRIVSVTPADAVAIPSGARVVDGNGKYLIPGLADMHAHLSLSVPMPRRPDETEVFLARMLYYGVTSILALGGTDQSTDMINALRARQAEGSLWAPWIYATGGHLTLPGAHPVATIFPPEVREATEAILAATPEEEPANLYDIGIGISLVRTDEAARLAIRERAAGGMDAIKITVEDGPTPLGVGRPRMPLSMIRAIVEEAAVHGLPVFAHVSSPDELADVLTGGAAGVLHTVIDAPLPDEAVARRIIEQGFVYVPTLTLYDNFTRYWNDPGHFDDPFLRATVSAEEVASFDSPAFIEGYSTDYFDGPLEGTDVRRIDAVIENVGFLHALGVPMVVGTDTGNPYTFPGYSVHQELELLVRARLTPAEALAAGTLRAAGMLGREDEFGTIEAGKRADLVLLDANPLDDILNTRRIHAVVADGWFLDRAELDALLIDGEPAPSAPPIPAGVTGVLGDGPDGLVFRPCPDESSFPISDDTDRDLAAVVVELGYGSGAILAHLVLDDGDGDGPRVARELRVAAPEVADCDRLLPAGDLQARGNEPFWTITIRGDEALWTTPEDMPGTTFHDGEWSAIAGGWRFEALRDVTDGTDHLIVEFHAEPCQDTMLGAHHPFTIAAEQGGSRYQGCGLEGADTG